MKRISDILEDDFVDAEIIAIDKRVRERIAARDAEENTPERRAAREREAAVARFRLLSQRADDAEVPKTDDVRRHVLNDNAEQTEAVVSCHEALGRYEEGRKRRRWQPFTLFLGASFGRGKTIGICHACVRSERTFLYVSCAAWPGRLYDDDDAAKRERMGTVEILAIDDLELLPANDRFLQSLLRRREAAGLPVFGGGNIAQSVAEDLVGDAMLSRLLAASAQHGHSWFKPAPKTSPTIKGDLLGPTMRPLPTR